MTCGYFPAARGPASGERAQPRRRRQQSRRQFATLRAVMAKVESTGLPLNSSTPQGKCPLSVHAGKGRQAAEIRFPLCVELFRGMEAASLPRDRSGPREVGGKASCNRASTEIRSILEGNACSGG